MEIHPDFGSVSNVVNKMEEYGFEVKILDYNLKSCKLFV